MELNPEQTILYDASTGETFPVVNGIPQMTADDNPVSLSWMKLFDKIAADYDRTLPIMFAERGHDEIEVRHQVIQHLRLVDGMRLLETACGTASNALLIHRAVEYVGVDISNGMLATARRKILGHHLPLELVRADISKPLPFQNCVFDAVLHMTGLQYVADPLFAIQELIRVSKPGSTIVLAEELRKSTYLASLLLQYAVPDLMTVVADLMALRLHRARVQHCLPLADDELFCLVLITQ